MGGRAVLAGQRWQLLTGSSFPAKQQPTHWFPDVTSYVDPDCPADDDYYVAFIKAMQVGGWVDEQLCNWHWRTRGQVAAAGAPCQCLLRSPAYSGGAAELKGVSVSPTSSS